MEQMYNNLMKQVCICMMILLTPSLHISKNVLKYVK